MKKFEVKDEQAIGPAHGPYSQGLVSGNLFFTGVIGSYGEEGKLPESVYEQTLRIFDNTRNLLERAGGGLEDIVNITVFLLDISDFDEMNRAYQECLTKRPLPARATVAVKEMLEGVKVEMIVTAMLPEKEEQ